MVSGLYGRGDQRLFRSIIRTEFLSRSRLHIHKFLGIPKQADGNGRIGAEAVFDIINKAAGRSGAHGVRHKLITAHIAFFLFAISHTRRAGGQFWRMGQTWVCDLRHCGVPSGIIGGRAHPVSAIGRIFPGFVRRPREHSPDIFLRAGVI